MAIARGGHALVMDTRTANGPRYVTETLRRAAIEAAEKGILTLPADASWASLASLGLSVAGDQGRHGS